jgi:hypothetical protein
MGGGNAQKSAAAREKNMKDAGKTDAQRKEASDKAKKDAHAFVCKLCKQTFMVNATPEILFQHVTTKHAKEATSEPTICFDKLADFDPLDPTGEKAAKEARKIATAAAEKKQAAADKKKKAADGDMFSQLDAGLKKGKSGGKNKFGK